MGDPQPGRCHLLGEALQSILGFVGGVQPPLHTQFALEWHPPIPLEEGHADQESGRAPHLLHPTQKRRTLWQMLQDVGKDDYIERAIGKVLQCVADAVLDPGVGIALAGLSDVIRVEVYAHHMGPGLFGHVVGHSSHTTADVQYSLVCANPVNEKIVVTRVTVLGVDATVVFGRFPPQEGIE
jgi:hypothetical protein